VLSFDVEDITAVQIIGVGVDGGPSEPIRLVRKQDDWLLSSLDGFPARGDRVQDLLHQLAALKVREPVSADPKQHDSLGVAPGRFGRKVSLFTDDQQATFYVGQGQGHSVYLRVEGSDEVYLTHGTTVWKLAADPADYLEREYFGFDPTQLVSIEVQSPQEKFVLKVNHGVFMSPQLPATQRLKQDVLNHLVRKTSRLVTRQPLGNTASPEHGFESGTTLHFELETAKGGTLQKTLHIGRPAGALVPVKAASSDFYVLCSVAKVRGFLDSNLSEFIAE
jgi:hypothetical protein